MNFLTRFVYDETGFHFWYIGNDTKERKDIMNQTILKQKQELVETIADQISKAGSTVVVEYRGLTVAEVTELRRALRDEKCEMVVYKNSMTQRAAEKLGYHDLLQSLKGPNAIAFSEDEIAASRVLSKFAKKHDKLVIKAGIVEDNSEWFKNPLIFHGCPHHLKTNIPMVCLRIPKLKAHNIVTTNQLPQEKHILPRLKQWKVGPLH